MMVGTAVLLALAAIWLYEAFAYWLNWWPTITQITKYHPNVGVVIIAAVVLAQFWLIAHFYGAHVVLP